MRFRITIDLTRTPKLVEQEPEFEHRDTEAFKPPVWRRA